MAIYFVQAGPDGPVKIGYARRPIKRVASLQVGSPVNMVLLSVIDGDQEMEKSIQARFRSDHLRGEWFLIGDELRKFLSSLPPPPQPFKSNGAFKRGRNPKGMMLEGRGRKRKLTSAQMAEVGRLLRTTSMTAVSVAKKFGISSTAIHYHFPRLREMRRVSPKLGRDTKLRAPHFAEIEELLLTQPRMTIAKIGKRFRISPTTVNNWFPGWRGKTQKERDEYRRLNPLPVDRT